MSLPEEEEFDDCNCSPFELYKCDAKKCLILKAVYKNDVASLKNLLDSPKWYKVRGIDEAPMLYYAVVREKQQVFDYLSSLKDYPLDLATPSGVTALMASLSVYGYSFDEDEEQLVEEYVDEYYAFELIRKGADIHRVCRRGNTLLHYAMKRNSIEIAKLLILRGIDINRQNNEGDTALHAAWVDRLRPDLETVKLLLCHGADPLIYNFDEVAPFDVLLFGRYTDEEIEPDQRDLFCYILDQYAEYDVSVIALLEISELDPPLFDRIIENTRQVVCNEIPDRATMLFTIDPSHLQILIEKFDYVVRKILDETATKTIYGHDFSIENFYVLMESKLKSEFSDWLSNVRFAGIFRSVAFFMPSESTVEEFICFLLSYGMTVRDTDLDLIYDKFGYCELLKILLNMDVTVNHLSIQKALMPQLLYYVTVNTVDIDVLEEIKESPSLLSQLSIKDLEEVLSYFAISTLKDYCDHFESSNSILKKLQNQPRVPLLVELARNVFRRYFIETLNIRSVGQFYTLVKSLPITPYHKRIITLEEKLY